MPVDALGNQVVALANQNESVRSTYHLAGLVTPAAAPTDVITIQGSGTKLIRVVSVKIYIEATAGGIADILLILRSTATTGGTSSAPTIGRTDPDAGNPTAAVLVWTANPAALGTLTANIGAAKVGFVSSGTAVPALFDYTQHSDQAILLRDNDDFLAINGNGDTLLAGEVWAYDITWTEE